MSLPDIDLPHLSAENLFILLQAVINEMAERWEPKEEQDGTA